MAKLSLNSLSRTVCAVKSCEGQGKERNRADIVATGRLLTYCYAKKGKRALDQAMKRDCSQEELPLNDRQYSEANACFQKDCLLYAARIACASTGQTAPTDLDELRRMSMMFYGNQQFYRVLEGIFTEVITPILPSVLSDALSLFAEMVQVDFGETYSITVGSNDIPVFQDSSWGASRSVPRNRFYDANYTLNPTPKSAWITAKWTQLVGNHMDFGRFFSNLAAGMYAKNMGLWTESMQTAAADTSLIPAGLNYTFNTPNWVAAENKIMALNRAPLGSLFATGSIVPLSRVLPTETTGSTNVNMDAAIATLLGAEYTRSGYLGEFMGVNLLPMLDAIVPGTQNTTIQTVLSQNDVWMMASNGFKPMTIAYNSATPITLEMDPTRTADFEIGINLTMALDAVAVFASKIAHFTIPTGA